MLLGCIADDFTGATDLANNLVRQGMRVIQTLGIPDTPLPDEAIDAVVVALKSRTIPAPQAIEASVDALRWLRSHGAKQIYFKYCSTFDSTPAGNIGPVSEALMQALGTDFAIATPAFPDNGRTVFKGHLFVGEQLLSDSGMRDHPLTPMTDSSLVRVLQAQCTRKVGLIDHRVVSQGASAIEARIQALRAQGISLAIVDAVSNEDLFEIGAAVRDHALVTAGSGVAIGLPRHFGVQPSPQASRLAPPSGRQAILAGSCSQATQAQVADFRARGGACLALDPRALAGGDQALQNVVDQALRWAQAFGTHPILIYSTDTPEAVRDVQAALGIERAGALVEQAMALICKGLIDSGVRQLIVAGGETSGACVQALGLSQLRIGPQIDPGVPWCQTTLADGSVLHVALKSGNFGATDFFTRSLTLLT
ncbi:MAG: 3-oxo-tetronate kinase [Burkholderiaceae bacterium]